MLTRISVLGVTVICAALLVLMTAFNGIEKVIEQMYDSFDPDISINHKTQKTFTEKDISFKELNVPEVKNISKSVEQIVVLENKSKSTWVKIMGIELEFLKMTNFSNHVIYNNSMCDSEDCLFKQMGQGVFISPEIAQKIDLNIEKNAPIKIISAKRRFNKLKPYQFNKTNTEGVFSYNKETNEKVILTTLENAQKYLGYGKEISTIYIDLNDGSDKDAAKEKIQKIVGNNFSVQTNYEKNELIFKTSKSERRMMMVILIFIVFLVAVNIISSMTILFLEKKSEMETLKALGLGSNSIRWLYFFQGIFISFFGLIIGLTIGFLLSWLQMKFEFISIDNGKIPYPMHFNFLDIISIASIVLFIGGVFSYISSSFLIRNLSR